MNQDECTGYTRYMEAARMQGIKFIAEQERRIKGLETCATINAETIGHVAELRRVIAAYVVRIAVLEQQVDETSVDIDIITGGLGHTQNTISLHAKRIEKLEAALGPWLEEMVTIMADRDDPSQP